MLTDISSEIERATVQANRLDLHDFEVLKLRDEPRHDPVLTDH